MARKEGFHYKIFFKKNLTGILLLSVLGMFLGTFNESIVAGNMAVKETVPFYNEKVSDRNSAFKIESSQPEKERVFLTDGGTEDVDVSLETTLGDGGETPHYATIIGEDDISYQPETDIELTNKQVKEALTKDDVDRLRNLGFLKKNFYIVDKRTDITEQDFNVDNFLSEDLKIDNSISGPKVLIFHTHSSEGFVDSDMSDPMNGIMGAGEKLAQLLEDKYGIETLHHLGRYDIVDGKGQILGAYERMEPDIRNILKENPSIQVVIDMHRDGVAGDTRLVKNINGKDCAQIMFFNGLCKLNKNGVLEDISGLSNPYVKDNLALSFNMQLMSNNLYPTLTRKIYLNAYRYSLHMMPKSMLIEVGAQTNTRQEVDNSMELLAEILAGTILGE